MEEEIDISEEYAGIEEYAGLKRNEKLLGVFRKSVVPYRLAFLAPFFVMFFMAMAFIYIENGPFRLYDGISCPVIMAILFWRAWFLWSRSMVLLTNVRVIYVVQQTLFSRLRSEAYLCDICQVSEKVKGFNQALFKFGNVLVQTEAELWLEDVEHPDEVAEAIYKALGRDKHKEFRALPNKFWRGKQKTDKTRNVKIIKK